MNREQRRKRKRRRRANRGALVISFVVLALFCVVSVQKHQLKEKSTVYAQKQEHLENQLTEAKEKQEELKDQEAYMQTKKYVEEVAKEKLGLVNKDEVVFTTKDK